MTPPLPIRHPQAVHEAAGENAHVLRRRDDGSEHLVNETALALWQLCDGRTTIEEIVEGVCALFDAPPEAVADDIDRALEQLSQAGLIRWPENAAADDAGDRGGPLEGAWW